MSNRTAAARWRWLRQHIKTLRNAELEPEEKGTTWRFAGLVVAAIPALTAATYLLGMAYHYGYTLAFNLDYAEFSPPADYLLAFGLLTTLNMLKPWMWPVLGSILTIFFMAFILITSPRRRLHLTWLWQTSSLYRWLVKRAKKRRRYPAPSLFKVFVWMVNSYDKFAFLLLSVLIPVMGALWFFVKGVEEAQTQISRLEQDKWPQTEAHSQSPLLGDEPHIRIACNASHCAYRLKGGDTLILRFDQIEETRYRPDKAASK
ncbi:hypothetical protein [Aeromonas dhakensis]|uniref:hypothetical protein n=1 Tax=Aeromonas dhakensis TaxID=196024 RepID=UPI0005AB2E02|nr:hypothetical protein [Aeromonas dhakensis]